MEDNAPVLMPKESCCPRFPREFRARERRVPLLPPEHRVAYNLAGGCTHTWPHSYLNLDEQSWDAPSASGFVPWVCGPGSPRWTLTVELEDRQLSSLLAAVRAHCSRMVPTCSGCIEFSYESSAPPGCPATHLQSPPGAGRRAPLLRRLSAVRMRPRPPHSG